MRSLRPDCPPASARPGTACAVRRERRVAASLRATGFGVEESPAVGIAEAVDHFVAMRLRKVEVAHRAGDFVSVEAGERGESVIVEQAANEALLGCGIGVGDDMRKSALVIPGLGQNAVERAQRELARVIQAEHLCRLQVRRDAHSVPTHVNRLVDERRRTLQACCIQLRLGRGEQVDRVLL